MNGQGETANGLCNGGVGGELLVRERRGQPDHKPFPNPKVRLHQLIQNTRAGMLFWGFGGGTLREHRRADAARLRLPTANQRGQFGFGPQPEGAIGGGREQPCRQRPGLTVREAGRQRGKEAVAKMQWQRGSGKGAVAKRQWHRSRRKFAKETVHSG